MVSTASKTLLPLNDSCHPTGLAATACAGRCAVARLHGAARFEKGRLNHKPPEEGMAREQNAEGTIQTSKVPLCDATLQNARDSFSGTGYAATTVGR